MSLPADLTNEIITRLKSIEGQVRGLQQMIEENQDPEKVLILFKAIQKAMDASHYLLLDEVYRKALAIKIVETANACPGNCGNEDRIEFIRKQFPELALDELTDKLREITEIKKRIDAGKDG